MLKNQSLKIKNKSKLGGLSKPVFGRLYFNKIFKEYKRANYLNTLSVVLN